MNELDSSAIMAKKILFGIFVGLIVFQAVLIAIVPDIRGVVRMILTLLLMYFVMEGHKWAKWVMVVLFYLATVYGLFVSATLYKQPSSAAIFPIILAIIAIVYGAVGTFMVASKPLNRYFLFKRNHTTP